MTFLPAAVVSSPSQACESSDPSIVERVLAGDTEAYSILVGRHQATLFRHALGMVGDPDAAADLTQDALVRGYTRLDRCRDPARFGGWIFRILKNRCRDHLKNHRRRNVELKDDVATAPERDGPEWAVHRHGLREEIRRALATLPEAQREALLLKHVEECSYEEMAVRLEVSVSALKMRVMRAREALRDLLAE